jgi:hypothetical protein
VARVAFTTFAILHEPYGHEVVRGFEDREGAVFEEAEQSPGFIARAKELEGQQDLSNFERDWGAWGKFYTPRFYTGGRTSGTDSRASTLSLWIDIQSVYRFTYHGLHLEALQHRHEWFLKPQWPTFALWWVGDNYIPTWSEACMRLEHLHDHGPTAFSFSFKKMFDEHGSAIDLKVFKQSLLERAAQPA